MESERYVTPEVPRFSLYRLCECETCGGDGKWIGTPEYVAPGLTKANVQKCSECRGEGRVRQELAVCDSPEAVGVALVTLGREGEWQRCQFGLLDREGEKGRRWLVLPWPETARTASAAGRLLASRKR